MSKTPPSAFWRDRSVFVSGATGLLGSWMVEHLLRAGADIVALVRDAVPQSELFRSGNAGRIRSVHGDIRDQELLERVLGEYEVDTVFHLAAQTSVGVANRNPVSTLDTNIRGTWALCEAARRSPLVRSVVIASSDKAYGSHDVLPYTESAALQGIHPYDVSKSAADLISQMYAFTYNVPLAITRCGNFFGGGDLNWNRLFPGTIRSALRGEVPTIRSDGTFVRDYLYIEDGVLAYLALAEALHGRPELRGEAFNFSNELQLDVRTVVQRILECTGSTHAPRVLGEAQHEIAHQWLSAEKARTMLGWAPTYSFDEGLERTISWYRGYLDV